MSTPPINATADTPATAPHTAVVTVPPSAKTTMTSVTRPAAAAKL